MSGNRLKADRLRFEMARRGLQACDLARLAMVSPATMTAALHGRPVSPRTLGKLAAALLPVPVVPGADDLLDLTGTGTG